MNKKYIIYNQSQESFLGYSQEFGKFNFTKEINQACEMSLKDATKKATSECVIVPAPFCSEFFKD